MAIQGRTSSLTPSGVTTRAHTLRGRRIDDALPFDDHDDSRYPTRPSDGGLRLGRPRLLIPTVEQRRNLLEQEVVKVAHLRETLTGRAAVLGGGDPGFGGLEHR